MKKSWGYTSHSNPTSLIKWGNYRRTDKEMNEPSKCRDCQNKSICLPYDYYFRPHSFFSHIIECLLISSGGIAIGLLLIAITWFNLLIISAFGFVLLIFFIGFNGVYGSPKEIECGHFQYNLPEITGRNYEKKVDIESEDEE